MPMRDAAPLVSLLGHELRAPAGVIGGYLTLIERALDRLTPEQQQAVAGARRAQHRLVEILDDASRLTVAWRADTPAPTHAGRRRADGRRARRRGSPRDSRSPPPSPPTPRCA